jgi:tetratricopeptide (TPR) repeat protein
MSTSFLRRKNGFDRNRILAEASKARAKRRRHKAVALYRWVLAVEPRNPELHARLGPLLAETGQEFDAWVSYRAAGGAFVRQGLLDKAVGLYREAARLLPREVKVWHSIARLQCEAGREAEALETLLEGSRQFKARWARPQAIFLLRRAREIDAWHFKSVLDLARLLASTEQRKEAELLLDGLGQRCQGAQLRRVRRGPAPD